MSDTGTPNDLVCLCRGIRTAICLDDSFDGDRRGFGRAARVKRSGGQDSGSADDSAGELSHLLKTLLGDRIGPMTVHEQASVGVERLKPTYGFAHQLRNAISMVGGWRKGRRYWDEDPSLEHERLRMLVGGWPLPAPGQLLSGYARM